MNYSKNSISKNDCCDPNGSGDNYNVAECEGRRPNLTNTIYNGKKTLTLILTEKSSVNGLYTAMYSGCLDLNTCTWLERHIANGKIKNGVIQHKIEYSSNQYGRFSIKKVKKGKNEKGEMEFEAPYCQMYMKRIVKYYACKDIYDDYDFVNAQPVILNQLFLGHGFTSTHLQHYIDNRDSILMDICERDNINRLEAKNLVLKVLYGNKKSISSKCKFINKLCKEVHKNRKDIVKEYPDIMKYVEKKKVAAHGVDVFNKYGKILAIIGQTLERKCLHAMYEYITNNGGVVGSLIHDGIHVEKRFECDIEDIKQYVLEHTGIDIDIKVKEFELPEYTYTDNQNIKFETLVMNHDRVIVKDINNKYLTKLNENDENGIDLHNMIEINNISMIKSYTGSGKTTMIKKFIDSHNMDVLSVVSRISLADAHANLFNLKNYQNVHEHGVNEVYCYDSIRKCNTIENDFILILDEVASLLSHCFNTNHAMSSNRINIVGHLRDIINHPNCKYVLACDDNINDGTLQFMTIITNKPIVLFKNNYCEKRDTPITVYLDQDCAVKKCVELINSGEKMFICSNRNNIFKEQIYQYIIDECHLTSNEYILYSGDEGATTIDSNFWFTDGMRVVFTTPSIVYGIDYNKEDIHTFAFYMKGNTLDAMGMNQQINRIRKPKHISIYMNNNKFTPFESLEETKESIDVSNLNLKINGTVNKALENIITMGAIIELRAYDKYRESHHYNTRHHLLQLLRGKGFYDISVIADGNKVEYISKEAFKEKQIKNSKEIDETQDEDNKKLKVIQDRRKCFKLHETKFTKDIPKDKLAKYNDTFIHDDSMFQSLMTYSCMFNKNYRAYNEKDEIIDNDVIECKITSTKMKVQLLRDIRTLIGLPEYFTSETELIDIVNRKNHLDFVEVSETLKNRVIKCFKPKFFPNRYGNLVAFYSSKLRGLIPKIVGDSKRHKCTTAGEAKRYTLHKIDMKMIGIMNEIVKHKADIDDIKTYQLDDSSIKPKKKKKRKVKSHFK